MRPIFTYIIILLCLLILTSCAANVNPLTNTPAKDGKVAGFWLGLWHGIICPIAWVISLFVHTVTFYEVHNNGGWYNFGFILGVGGVFNNARRHRKW